MLVAGIIKYSERTYSLYRGSFDGVLASILRDPDPGANYAKLMMEYSARQRAGLEVEIVAANGMARKAQQEMEMVMLRGMTLSTKRPLVVQAHAFFLVFRSICYDITLSYHDRKRSQTYFLDRNDVDATEAFQMMEVELNFLYDMVHTKAPVAHRAVGWVLRIVSSGCLVAALVSFLRLDKGDIQRVDVGITYALLHGALALDAAALATLVFFSDQVLVFLGETPRRGLGWLAWLVKGLARARPRRWSEMTTRLNLINYCLRKPKNDNDDAAAGGRGPRRLSSCCSPRVIGVLATLADALHMKGTIIDWFFVRREPLKLLRSEKQPPLVNRLFEELRETARRARHSQYEEMRKACSYRGERVLSRDGGRMGATILEELKNATKQKLAGLSEEEIDEHVNDKLEGVLLASIVNRDLDESLVMWHIATDLCLAPRDGNDDMSVSEALLEYMLCLLIRQPKLLSASAGAGQMTYWDTCAEAHRFFKSAEPWDPNHTDARTMLLDANTSVDPVVVKDGYCRSVLFDACILAKVLRELTDQTLWKVLSSVWIEMLMYAAAGCKGSTHVHHLSRGGELITLVWFLMAHMGIGDVYHKEETDAKPRLIVHGQ